MATLADKAILSGADNHPLMLEKDMYDSLKSRIELYMMNRQHGRMIFESIENGPLIWPSIEENEVTSPKKYSELSATEVIQADCDVKATNIILQGPPPEVYALVSNHKVPKELWERIQLLMQGTSLTKQEREGISILADPGIAEGQATQTIITHNVAYQVNDLDAYNSHCDELNTAKVAPVANLSHYGSNALAEPATQNSKSFAQQDAMILSVIEQLKTQVVNCTKINLDNKSVNDTLTAELERYKEQVKVLKEGQHVTLKKGTYTVSDSCAQSVEIDLFKQTLS
uniref:Integrase, catalytic region, zinc finger, CCHC-type, peptidase aspartic, catalytic n=1 Tax=Tanacetum cinerariifolium TaxID=118510 RepID=A0A699IK60_TANCI|nr:hypothetical protein [Tanacetum cinerariifolium]